MSELCQSCDLTHAPLVEVTVPVSNLEESSFVTMRGASESETQGPGKHEKAEEKEHGIRDGPHCQISGTSNRNARLHKT